MLRLDKADAQLLKDWFDTKKRREIFIDELYFNIMWNNTVPLSKGGEGFERSIFSHIGDEAVIYREKINAIFNAKR